MGDSAKITGLFLAVLASTLGVGTLTVNTAVETPIIEPQNYPGSNLTTNYNEILGENTVLPNTNYVSVTDGLWRSDGDWQPAPIRTLTIDYTELYAGQPSWKVLWTDIDSAVDHGNIPVQVGDTISFSCQIKTSAPTIPGDIVMAGGRIGIDVYGANGASYGTAEPHGGTESYYSNTYVPFSTSAWTERTISFQIPATMTSNQGAFAGTVFTPVFCIVWCQTWSAVNYATERGTAWFANPIVYVIPSEPVVPPIEPPTAQYFYVQMMTGSGGSTTPTAGNRQYIVGETATLTASPNPNYHFDKWLVNGATYSTSNVIQIVGVANAAYTVQPEFHVNTVAASTWTLVMSMQGGNGVVSPSVGAHSISSLTQTVSAAAVAGCEFVSWLYDGATTYTTASLTLTAAFGETHTLKAIFQFTDTSQTVQAPQNSNTFSSLLDRAEQVNIPTFNELVGNIEQRNI